MSDSPVYVISDKDVEDAREAARKSIASQLGTDPCMTKEPDAARPVRRKSTIEAIKAQAAWLFGKEALFARSSTQLFDGEAAKSHADAQTSPVDLPDIARSTSINGAAPPPLQLPHESTPESIEVSTAESVTTVAAACVVAGVAVSLAWMAASGLAHRR